MTSRSLIGAGLGGLVGMLPLVLQHLGAGAPVVAAILLLPGLVIVGVFLLINGEGLHCGWDGKFPIVVALSVTFYASIGFLVARRGSPKGTRNDGPRCGACGYNLTGLTEPRCPECGTGYTPK